MSGTDQPAIWALIPAAGIGSRMAADRPKQYLDLAGVPVIIHTLRAIDAYRPLKGILLGLSETDGEWPRVNSALAGLTTELITFNGGAERADTVLLGLQEIVRRGGENDWVLVHDAVRPLVSVTDINRLVSEVSNNTDGGLLALPVADTLKSELQGCANSTVDRSHLWRALTPQFFPVARLMQALAQCRDQSMLVTDESSAIEHTGGKPRLVTGSADNIKLTYPSDLEMAESLILSRSKT